jgi:OPT family oligopeptide transporter
VRAVVAGCLLGGAVSAMNIYFGLRTGWSIGGSLIAAILGFAIFTAIKPKNPYTVLEANITQTAGSAAGTMTSAAGLLAAIPALGMLGHQLSYVELTAWAFAVAYLGVFFAVPLRRQMVLVEKLRFPTGTATAETIVAMFSEGASAMEKARVLLFWGVLAAVFTQAAFWITPLGQPPLDVWLPSLGFLAVAAGYSFSLYISPLMFGAGILIGPRVATSLMLGAVFSWGILAPFVESQGWVAGPTMSYAEGARGWILWPGVAIMVADALTSLGLSWRTVLDTFTGFKGNGDAIVEDLAENIPNSWWMIGLAMGSAATLIVAWWIFAIPWYFTLIAVALSSVLAMIAVRSTGETDINPIGGMGKVTQLVFGGIAPGMMTTNLMAAAIAGAGASQAGDMMQDLKTGHMLGASPREQFKAQCIGILAGVLFAVPIYILFDKAYTIGEGDLPAPAAHAWKAMAELLSQGLGALPENSASAVLGGLIFGALVPILRKNVPLMQKWLPSGLAFGIAFIVPAFYSISMFIGMVIFQAWRRGNLSRAEALGFSIASGLIAGEGLMGIVVAIQTLLGMKAII